VIIWSVSSMLLCFDLSDYVALTSLHFSRG
jgi:hypothetical protein